MLPGITTTHAIPRRISPVRLSLPKTVVCQYCFETLGSAMQPSERRSLELRHKCREKVLAELPAISVPFS
jgi:hypothetical protein